MKVNDEEIYDDCFGLWIDKVWHSIAFDYSDMNFEQHKQAFFCVLRKWLKEEKVYFCTPEEPLTTRWKEDPDVIVDYMEKLWPENVDDDPMHTDLIMYFFSLPAVVWLCDDGYEVSSFI